MKVSKIILLYPWNQWFGTVNLTILESGTVYFQYLGMSRRKCKMWPVLQDYLFFCIMVSLIKYGTVYYQFQEDHYEIMQFLPWRTSLTTQNYSKISKIPPPFSQEKSVLSSGMAWLLSWNIQSKTGKLICTCAVLISRWSFKWGCTVQHFSKSSEWFD